MKKTSVLKRLLKWAIFFLLMGVILLAGIYFRNYLLRKLQSQISSYFTYAQIKVSLFPTRLTFEGVKLTSENPSFSAQSLIFETKVMPLARTRPVKVIINRPIIHYRQTKGANQSKPTFKLPSSFLIDRILLRDATIWLDLGGQVFWAENLQALWKRQGNGFNLEAEASRSSFSLGHREIMSAAQLKISINNRDGEVKVNRFLMTETDRYMQFKGSIKNLAEPEINFQANFWFPLASIDAWLNFPFSWQGKVGSKGQLLRRFNRWSYQGEIFSPEITLNGLVLGQAKGWIETTLGQRGDLKINFEHHGLTQELTLSWEKGKLAGRYAHFYLDPILKGLKLPWPVKSPSWGKFYLANQKLVVEGELREKNFEIENGRYPFQGAYYIVWDTKKRVEILARDILSNFARFSLSGQLDLGEKLRLDIQSEIADIALTRLFLQNLFQKSWNLPLLKGQAEARINIIGRPKSPEILVHFDASPLNFSRFEVKEASGLFKIASGRFDGLFRFHDPYITGEAEVKADSSGLAASLAIKNGDWSKALEGLKIKFPLQGRFDGAFNFERPTKGPYMVRGEFSSPEMILLGKRVKRASGLIIYDQENIHLPKFTGELAGGRIAAAFSLHLPRETYTAEFSGQNLNLHELVSGIKGLAQINLKGSGKLNQDKIKGDFEIKDLAISLYKKPWLKGQTELLISRLGLEAKLFAPEKEEESFEIKISSSFGHSQLAIQAKGKDNLLTLIPWKGTKGSFNYLFEIRQDGANRRVTGIFETNGSLLPFPRFPHPLTDFSLLVFLHDQNLSLRSFQGKLGGGEIEGFGELKLISGSQFEADLQLDGRNMVLSPLDRTRFLTDASLRLVKKEDRYILQGLFSIKKAYWRREFFEGLGVSSYTQKRGWPSLLEGLTLALRLKADDQVWVENSLARIRARLDLSINGDIQSPFILGEVEALDGSINFQERVFRLLKGKIILTNPAISAPIVDLKGETYVQDYRVNFSLSGPMDRLKPEFSSSPPLSSEEVLALLALGESFKRITSSDVVSQISTTSFLSGEIIEEAKKKAQRVLNLDRLRIDPFVLGSSAEMTARLTVGKKISENFFILYSTNLTTQREEIVRIEWEIRPGLSIVGIRDELGRLSFDLKIRRRF